MGIEGKVQGKSTCSGVVSDPFVITGEEGRRSMGFADAVRTCLRRYADFSGRASRAEFWWFFLFTFLVTMVLTLPLYIVSVVVSLMDGSSAAGLAFAILLTGWSILVAGVSIALLIPLLAVGSRRLHDYGQPAWWLLLYLVPCGNLVLLVFWALDGTPGENQYGARPLQ